MREGFARGFRVTGDPHVLNAHPGHLKEPLKVLFANANSAAANADTTMGQYPPLAQ
jgi:hypothetical protein